MKQKRWWRLSNLLRMWGIWVFVRLQKHSRGPQGREMMWKKHNTNRKKPVMDTKGEEFSVLQGHTTIKPHRLSSGITAEPSKCVLSLLQSLWGRGGQGPARSQHPEQLSLSRNPTNESPFQDIWRYLSLLEPKLGAFHVPSTKGNSGNSNRVKENAKRN